MSNVNAKTKCKHFNGLMNKVCKASVHYDQVKVNIPGQIVKLPCIDPSLHCACREYKTDEEIQKEESEMAEIVNRMAKAYIEIQKSKLQSGKVDCECGGQISFTRAKTNGHIWAKCNKCKMFFNE